MTPKILVTGAGGFIGGYIVEEALKKGFDTWAGIRSTTSRKYLQDSSINFVDLDFAHPDNLQTQLSQLKEQMGGWDYIVHNLGVTKCKNCEDFYRTNYQFLRNFVEALIACDMVPKKFIYMSSLSAWGKGDEKNHTPIKLSDTPCPDTEYGKSKLMSEKYLNSLPDFPYMILRPTGVYGPREKDYLLMIKSIKAGFDFGVGYDKQLLTFIYVKDLVRAIFAAIEAPFARRSYFISEEQAYTTSDFRKYVAAELGKKWVVPIVMPCWLLWIISVVIEWVCGKLGKISAVNRDKYKIMSQRNWICDTTPAKNELGFVPQYSLEEGLRETIAWYKENKWL